MQLAALVSIGGKLPDGSRIERGKVLYISAEDDPSYTIRPRIEVMNGDPAYVRVLIADMMLDPDGFSKLRAELDAHDVRLIFIDPLMAFISEKTDVNRSNSVRPVLSAIKDIAENYGCPVIFIRQRLIPLSPDTQDVAAGGCGARYVLVMFRHARTLDIRSPHVAPGVRGAVSGRRGLRPTPRSATLARRLRLSGLRQPKGLGAGPQATDMGMRRVSAADFGDRRHLHA